MPITKENHNLLTFQCPENLFYALWYAHQSITLKTDLDYANLVIGKATGWYRYNF